MAFSLQYKNKLDVFEDNKPEPNNNETRQYKLDTILSSYNSLSCSGVNDILLSGNWDSFKETETMIGISNRGNIIQRLIIQALRAENQMNKQRNLRFTNHRKQLK